MIHDPVQLGISFLALGLCFGRLLQLYHRFSRRAAVEDITSYGKVLLFAVACFAFFLCGAFGTGAWEGDLDEMRQDRFKGLKSKAKTS